MKKSYLISALMILLSAVILSGCGKEKDFNGEWAEKTAERIVATFTPDGDGYSVSIGWREEGLAQYEVWEMNAVRDGKNSLHYTGGTYKIRRYENIGDENWVEEVIYTDGEGSFSFNRDNDIVWTDGKDPDGTTVFMKAAFGN